MAAVPHFTLDSLPPRFRPQVERELALVDDPRAHARIGVPHAEVVVPIGVGSSSTCGSTDVSSTLGRNTLSRTPAHARGGKKCRNKAKGRKARSPIVATNAGGKGKHPDSSHAEAEFNVSFLGGAGLREPITLRLAGGVYTPDFMYEDVGAEGGTTSRIVLCEVKGSYRLPTHGRSVFAFKQACADFPMFDFVFAEQSQDHAKTDAWKIARFNGGGSEGAHEIARAEGTPASILSDPSTSSVIGRPKAK